MFSHPVVAHIPNTPGIFDCDPNGNPCAYPTKCIEDTDKHWICNNPVTGGTTPIPSFNSPTDTQDFSCFVCNVTNLISKQLLPPLAVLMTLVVGFLFLVSGGDPGKATTAKKALFFMLIGVAVLILAPGIASLISDIFGGASVAPSSCIACTSSIVTSTIISALVNLVNWFSWFVAVTSVVMGLYAGFLYMTAGGRPDQVARASRVLSFTIIGIAVSVVAFSIIALVGQFLG